MLFGLFVPCFLLFRCLFCHSSPAAQCALAPRADSARAQPAATDAAPIAIVSLDSKNPDAAAKVTGALEVSQGRAVIVASGTITSGSQTTEVVLPHRGVLRVCASTTVKLAADSSVPAGETPGLMMAMDHGALEMSFATSAAAGRNADFLMTPDFRILIGGPGAAEIKVRLGQHGDTCVDNAGVNAPYVLVTSVFDGGNYRVQPGQRVMFEHGSLREVVDNEKEPCGCPPPLHPGTNEFPVAQSAGLAPLPKPAPNAVSSSTSTTAAGARAAGLQQRRPRGKARGRSNSGSQRSRTKPEAKKKPGFFGGIGNSSGASSARNKFSSSTLVPERLRAGRNRFSRSLFREFVHAVALTSEPEDRLVRKLSKALCALLTLPELSADPISESRVEKEDVLELLEVLLELEVLSVEVLRLWCCRLSAVMRCYWSAGWSVGRLRVRHVARTDGAEEAQHILPQGADAVVAGCVAGGG
jgi:hypothetical protein